MAGGVKTEEVQRENGKMLVSAEEEEGGEKKKRREREEASDDDAADSHTAFQVSRATFQQ